MRDAGCGWVLACLLRSRLEWLEVRNSVNDWAAGTLQNLQGRMSTVLSFRDLEVWQLGMQLVVRRLPGYRKISANGAIWAHVAASAGGNIDSLRTLPRGTLAVAMALT